jgi:hypothetical protein
MPGVIHLSCIEHAMNPKLQESAKRLSCELYDSIDQLPDVNRKSQHEFQQPEYQSGNLTFSVYNGSTSRAITWVENDKECRIWFEVRGMVHLTVDEDQVYSQVLYSEFPNDDFRGRANKFDGDIERFLKLAEFAKTFLSDCKRSDLLSDHDHLTELKKFKNRDDGWNQRQEYVVYVNRGEFSPETYYKFARVAYRDVPTGDDGIGGFVALSDTNAEVQGYNLRDRAIADAEKIVYRNATALNFELVDDDQSLVSLVRAGKITIEEISLG